MLHHQTTETTKVKRGTVAQAQTSSLGGTTFRPSQRAAASSQTILPVEKKGETREADEKDMSVAELTELERLSEEWDDALAKWEQTQEETMLDADKTQTNAEQEENAREIQFDSGYLSPHFVTDQERMEAVLESPRILIYDGHISNIGAMVPLLERIHKSDDPLLIVADGLLGDSLQTLVVNKIRGLLKVVAVQAPSYGDERQNMLKNIVTKTGGRVVSNDMDLRYLTPSDLGVAQRVMIDSGRTTIVP
jgi:chaperonin GroEL